VGQVGYLQEFYRDARSTEYIIGVDVSGSIWPDNVLQCHLQDGGRSSGSSTSRIWQLSLHGFCTRTLLAIKSAGQTFYFKTGVRMSADYNYAEDTSTIPDQGTTSLSSKR